MSTSATILRSHLILTSPRHSNTPANNIDKMSRNKLDSILQQPQHFPDKRFVKPTLHTKRLSTKKFRQCYNLQLMTLVLCYLGRVVSPRKYGNNNINHKVLVIYPENHGFYLPKVSFTLLSNYKTCSYTYSHILTVSFTFLMDDSTLPLTHILLNSLLFQNSPHHSLRFNFA
jgi:hypothetical protein